jgi:hypothetical protein
MAMVMNEHARRPPSIPAAGEVVKRGLAETAHDVESS